MTKEVPYYTIDDEGNSEVITPNAEAYIDDNDLKDLLIELLGDDVSGVKWGYERRGFRQVGRWIHFEKQKLIF